MLGTGSLNGNQVGSNERIPRRHLVAESGGSSFTINPQDREIVVDTSAGVATLVFPYTAEMNGNAYAVHLKVGGNNCAFSFPDSPPGYDRVASDRDLDATGDGIIFAVLADRIWVLDYVQA